MGPPNAITVEVHPAQADVSSGETQQFTATVNDASANAVTWSIAEPDGGTIDPNGFYTAPSSPGVFTVIAVSIIDPRLQGTAKVIVREVVPGTGGAGGAGGVGGTGGIGGSGGAGGSGHHHAQIKIEPAEVEVSSLGTQQFKAVVTGISDQSVTWTVEQGDAGGKIDSSGQYTAPPSAGTFTVVATSTFDPSARGTATVSVREPISVTIEPAIVEVVTNGSVQFQARLRGTDNQAVTWKVQEGDTGGSIDSNGVYSAPPNPGSFNIVATSVVDPSKSAVAEVAVVRPSSTDATGLLPPDRQTRWNPGLNAVGGIPLDSDPVRPATVYVPDGDPFSGFSVDPALANGTTDASNAIQAALNAAGAIARENARKIVFLAAGDYFIRGNGLVIPSFVTLRGQGPRGANATRLIKAPGSNMPVVQIGQLWIKFSTPIDLAADAPHGATQVTVVNNPGYSVGELVFIDQLVDTDRVGSWWNTVNQTDPNDGNRRWFCRQNRPTGQVLEIAGVDGNTLTFTTPLRLTYYTSNEAQIVRFSGDEPGGPVRPTRKWIGLEDILVDGGSGGQGNIPFTGTSYSWAKNVESVRSEGSSVSFTYAFRSVLRDSFIHSTVNPNPGGGGYGIDITTYSADNLLENNIVWNFNKVITMRASGGGNVIGYNYFEDGWGAGYPNIPEVGLSAAHYAAPHHELFEGNETWNIGGDAYWGNSIYITFFRNHVNGRRRSVPPLQLTDEIARRFVEVPEWQLWTTFIGNVLGSSDMVAAPQSGFIYERVSPPWKWDPVPIWAVGVEHNAGKNGQDAQVVATTIRHGNYDFVTRGIVWDAGIQRQDLPPSLYLEAKPPFFGDKNWPWVTPESDDGEVLGGLPAYERFDQLMGP
ncbi:MAG TPA: Ig-like domain-containing protein [Vulgatibacter sp.]|nr:Ig-like domain-containing protein [Vulgatibacter sp.]